MRLAYDLQVCQTRFAARGVGRYTQCLGQAMQELLLARGEIMQALLHADLPDNIPALRKAFCGAEFRCLHTAGADLPSGVSACLTADAYRSLSADAVCVGFPFENPPDYTGLPFDYRLTGKFIAGIFYDLIPLLFPKRYQMLVPNFQAGLPRVKSMNLLLAISETTRQDAIRCMELEPWQIVNISSGVSESFRKLRVRDEAGLLRRHGLGHRFVMYTGCVDWRKNHEGLIEAWARLDEDLRAGCQLAIVCAMDDQEKQRLLQFAASLGMKPGELVLTGYVPDEDLIALYNLTMLFVFPSLYEGFGLPIVEAMRCGAPVMGGDNSSIREIIQREEALFDAGNRDSMAVALERGLRDEGFRQHLRDWGAKRGRDFSWKRSAELALAAIDEGVARWQAEKGAKAAKKGCWHISGQVFSAGTGNRRLPRLAWVSPMPPDKSGIALWSQALLPYIRHHYDVDVYTGIGSHPAGHGDGLKPGCFDWHELPSHAADYEMIVYQMGDSSFHDYMLYLIECCPGIVVQHDFHLSHMLCAHGHAVQDYSLYEQHMFYSHGWQGLKAMLVGTPWDMNVMNAYPANKRILDKALQVIFLSESMIDWTRQAYGEEYVRRLAPAVVPTMILHREFIERNASADGQAREAMRKKYGFAPSDFLMMTFGLIGELKNPELLIDAARLIAEKEEGTDVKLVFVGGTTDEAYLETLRKRASSPVRQSWFRITGSLSHEEYCDYLLMADCAIQLRKANTNGPSGAVMECMLAGVPVIVNREASHGWPQGVVSELPDEAGTEQLSEILEELRRDEDKRREQAEKARAYVRERHDPESIALAYKQQIEKAKGKLEELAQDSFIEQAGQVLAEADASPEACLSMAACHERNWSLPGFRRVYVCCLHDSEVRALRDSEPQALRQDSRCELVPCRWDEGQQEFLVDMPVYDGSMASRVVPLTEADAVILPCREWAGQAAAKAGRCLASVYLAGEAQLLQNFEAQLSVLLAGTLLYGRMADFWAQVWALGGILPGEGRLLIDTSHYTYSEDMGGIYRLCTNMGRELCKLGEPVFVRQLAGHLVTNRAYARRIEGDSVSLPQEEAYVRFQRGDVLFLLDPVWGQTDAFRPLLEVLHRAGGRAYTVVHDLFPLTHPEWFICSILPIFRRWHEFVMRECDGLLCDSRATADSIVPYMLEHGIRPGKKLELHYFPCGAVKLSGEGEARPLLGKFLAEGMPVFLMVGVINPRKGYEVALEAFQKFWQQGGKAKLLIIGRHLFSPEIEEAILSVPDYGKRLLWLKDATDAELLYSYQKASCYLTASLDEGFGLPLVEAASYGLPVICSDIPVFREIGQGHADYFAVGDANALCQVLHEWLVSDQHPDTSKVHIVNWHESAACVLDILQGKQEPYMIMEKLEKGSDEGKDE